MKTCGTRKNSFRLSRKERHATFLVLITFFFGLISPSSVYSADMVMTTNGAGVNTGAVAVKMEEDQSSDPSRDENIIDTEPLGDMGYYIEQNGQFADKSEVWGTYANYQDSFEDPEQEDDQVSPGIYYGRRAEIEIDLMTGEEIVPEDEDKNSPEDAENVDYFDENVGGRHEFAAEDRESKESQEIEQKYLNNGLSADPQQPTVEFDEEGLLKGFWLTEPSSSDEDDKDQTGVWPTDSWQANNNEEENQQEDVWQPEQNKSIYSDQGMKDLMGIGTDDTTSWYMSSLWDSVLNPSKPAEFSVKGQILWEADGNGAVEGMNPKGETVVWEFKSSRPIGKGARVEMTLIKDEEEYLGGVEIFKVVDCRPVSEEKETSPVIEVEVSNTPVDEADNDVTHEDLEKARKEAEELEAMKQALDEALKRLEAEILGREASESKEQEILPEADRIDENPTEILENNKEVSEVEAEPAVDESASPEIETEPEPSVMPDVTDNTETEAAPVEQTAENDSEGHQEMSEAPTEDPLVVDNKEASEVETEPAVDESASPEIETEPEPSVMPDVTDNPETEAVPVGQPAENDSEGHQEVSEVPAEDPLVVDNKEAAEVERVQDPTAGSEEHKETPKVEATALLDKMEDLRKADEQLAEQLAELERQQKEAMEKKLIELEEAAAAAREKAERFEAEMAKKEAERLQKELEEKQRQAEIEAKKLEQLKEKEVKQEPQEIKQEIKVATASIIAQAAVPKQSNADVLSAMMQEMKKAESSMKMMTAVAQKGSYESNLSNKALNFSSVPSSLSLTRSSNSLAASFRPESSGFPSAYNRPILASDRLGSSFASIYASAVRAPSFDGRSRMKRYETSVLSDSEERDSRRRRTRFSRS